MPEKVPLADGEPRADPSWSSWVAPVGVAVAWKATAVAVEAMVEVAVMLTAFKEPPTVPDPEILKLEEAC